MYFPLSIGPFCDWNRYTLITKIPNPVKQLQGYKGRICQNSISIYSTRKRTPLFHNMVLNKCLIFPHSLHILTLLLPCCGCLERILRYPAFEFHLQVTLTLHHFSLLLYAELLRYFDCRIRFPNAMNKAQLPCLTDAKDHEEK